jgi:N-acetylglucosaminyldiphosphoundecaprenol N-acetyl-beta-D-mannosaminyltransferase
MSERRVRGGSTARHDVRPPAPRISPDDMADAAGDRGTLGAALEPADLRLLFGLPLAALRLDEVVGLAATAIREHRRLLVGVINAAKVVHLRRDAFLRDSLLECDVLLADGQSVVWASRILDQPLPERVAGIDLFQALMDLADREHHRVYLLGARQEVLERLLVVVAERWPGAVVAGSRDGYFDVVEGGQVADAIAGSRADLLFLGMTSPKKEMFLGSHGAATGVPVVHGVGGSFDVVAGLTRRAPLVWQRWGLEWAYRLLQEPRRLWRRYLVTNTVFMGVVLRERMRPHSPYVVAGNGSSTGENRNG